MKFYLFPLNFSSKDALFEEKWNPFTFKISIQDSYEKINRPENKNLYL